MKAMILAAGYGERLRPLTLETPKPLIHLHDKPFIQYQLDAVRRAGIEEVVINTHYHADQLQRYLAKQSTSDLKIETSYEPKLLGSAGGIRNVLDFFEGDPFLLLSSDVISNYDHRLLHQVNLQNSCAAHLILVPNPSFKPQGDFFLDEKSKLSLQPAHAQHLSYTYGNIGVFHPRLFAELKPGYADLGQLLHQEITAQRPPSGEVYQGPWVNIGTVEELERARRIIRS